MEKIKNSRYTNKEIEQTLMDFDLKIKKCLYQTNLSERDDLSQEIKLKIIEKLMFIEFKDFPSFWELLKEEDTE